MVETPERVVVGLVLLGAVLAAVGPVQAATAVDGEVRVTADGLETAHPASDGRVTAPGPDEHAAALVNLQAAPETDNTVTRIVLHPNGSATWTLQVRTRLENDEEASEYRAFQERFHENTSAYLGDFRGGVTGIVDGAREVTGREMRAERFAASTSIQTIPRRWGVVTFEFRWEGFAPVDGDRLVVGDVFEGGLFIAEGDSLEVVAPAGYRIASAEPTPDEFDGRVATWRGREDFADRRPRAVVEAAGTAATGPVPSPLLLGGAAVAVLGVLAALGYRRYGKGRGADGTPDPAAAAGAGDAASAAGPATTATAPSPPGEDVLMADEDYVLAALREHGGRMRQQAVAEELDWSRSKTSRVLGRMAEAGQVKKLQLGRENVIALPGELED